MYVCMYMCMYTCACISYIYSMSWIHRYMYITIPSPSQHHLARCQRRRWQYRMLVPLNSPPRPQRSHVRQPRVPPATSDIPLTLGRKNRIRCFGGKKMWLRNEGSWPVPPRGTTTEMGRERELRERDCSHKRSRNYSRKLRERTTHTTPKTFRIEETPSHQRRGNQDLKFNTLYGVTVQNMFLWESVPERGFLCRWNLPKTMGISRAARRRPMREMIGKSVRAAAA